MVLKASSGPKLKGLRGRRRNYQLACKLLLKFLQNILTATCGAAMVAAYEDWLTTVSCLVGIKVCLAHTCRIKACVSNIIFS